MQYLPGKHPMQQFFRKQALDRNARNAKCDLKIILVESKGTTFEKMKSSSKKSYIHSALIHPLCKPETIQRAIWFRARLPSSYYLTRGGYIFSPLQRHEWIRGRSALARSENKTSTTPIESRALALDATIRLFLNHLERNVRGGRGISGNYQLETFWKEEVNETGSKRLGNGGYS